jgi:WD40 repeat protein
VLIDVPTGQERPLTKRRWDAVGGTTWLPDGRSLAVSAIDSGRTNFQLWRVDAADGSVRRITNDLNNYEDVSAAATGSTLATVLGDWSSTVSVSAAGAPTSLRPITSGQGRYDGLTGLNWTPDGRILLTSADGGQLDLWIMDGDGKNPRKLSSDIAAEFSPCAMADGKSIVFASSKNEKTGLWMMNLDTGQLAQLTDNPADVSPLCALNGESVVFSRFDPEPRVYRVALKGGAPAIVGDFSAFALAIAPDGQQVASLFRVESKWVVALQTLDGATPTRGFDILSSPMLMQFTPSGDALTFVDFRKPPPSLWNQPLAGGEPQMLVDMKGDRVFAFAWSRDGRLAVAHGQVPTDVVLISGIR